MNTEITKAKRWEAREWCVCVFTFGGDAVALGQCIRALKRLRAKCERVGGELHIYVFDDGKHPLPYAPAGVEYEKTWFERGGNLNGVACVQGELVCMLKAVKASGAKYVVKLDSDTVVQDLGWMLEAFEEDEAYVEHVGVSLERLLKRLAELIVPESGKPHTGCSRMYSVDDVLEVAKSMGVLEIICSGKNLNQSMGHQLRKLKGREYVDGKGRRFTFGRKQDAVSSHYNVIILGEPAS